MSTFDALGQPLTEYTPPQCNLCTEHPAKMHLPAQGLWDWRHGTFIQVAFPEMPPDQREMIMTGTHPACWDTIFNEEES